LNLTKQEKAALITLCVCFNQAMAQTAFEFHSLSVISTNIVTRTRFVNHRFIYALDYLSCFARALAARIHRPYRWGIYPSASRDRCDRFDYKVSAGQSALTVGPVHPKTPKLC
jgi:hypothetical protein